MRRKNVLHTFIGVTLLLLFPVIPSIAFGAEDGRLDNISRVLEASTFSQSERVDLHAKALTAINAGVPAEDVAIIVSRAVKHGAGSMTISHFLDIGVSVKQSGLPAGPVLDRIEQGLSKGVPSERITAASERLAEKLAAARPIVDALIRSGMKPLRSSEGEAAIEATARALEKSLSPEAIQGIGAAVRGKRGSLPLFTGAVNAAAYFVGSGMSAKTASGLVQSAVEKGSSERGLNAMIKKMNEEMKRGRNAEEIAAKMEHESTNAEQGIQGTDRQDMQGEKMKNDLGKGSGAGSGMGGMGGGHRR